MFFVVKNENAFGTYYDDVTESMINKYSSLKLRSSDTWLQPFFMCLLTCLGPLNCQQMNNKYLKQSVQMRRRHRTNHQLVSFR